MIGPVSAAGFPGDQIPKYRKKAVKKTPKKANHKHAYEPVIFRYINQQSHFYADRGFVADYDYAAGSRCTICGRLDHGFPEESGMGKVPAVCSRVTIPVPWDTNASPRKRNILKPEYSHLPLVIVEDYWKLKEVKSDE